MAKSYLGYVERDQQAFVDWGAIGSQISKDLDKIRVNRQEQRDELDRVTNEAVTTINELTANQPQLVSEFYMDASNNMRQYLLMLNKEMKAGRLNPADYMKKKQVLMDGVTQLGDASKAFAQDYENSLKRLQDNESAWLEVFQNKQYDSFRNTEDKAIYVNPADGRVYIAKRNADGTINNNPADLLSVNKLYARRKDQINKFDVIGETSKKVSVLGDMTKALRRGNVLTLKDVTQKPEYLKAEGDIIKSMMASSRNASSILTDYIGGYDFTYDKDLAAKDPKMILLVEDGMGLNQPQLSAAQQKVAEEALRAQIRVQLDRVESPMPVYAPQKDSDGSGGFGVERQKDLGHLELLRKIYSGSSAEVDAALKYIPALNPEVKRVRKSGGNLTIEYNPVLDKDGNVVSQRAPQMVAIPQGGLELFATQSGRALIPSLNIESAYLDWQQSPYRVRPQGYSAAEGVSQNVFEVPVAFISQSKGEASETLRAALPNGFSVRPGRTPFDNDVVVTAPNGKEIIIETAETNPNVITGELAKIQKFVEENAGVSLESNAGGAASVNTSKYNNSPT
jgi:hypothetical protein